MRRLALLGLLLLTACGTTTGPSAPAATTAVDQRSTGSFTLAFAQCMRANGVPNFPDPNGQGGQLGPGSGIDPASAAYQHAIDGVCRSLAPPAWVSTGVQSSGGGS